MLFSGDAASISYRLNATSGRNWDLASGEVSRIPGAHRVLGRRAWASRVADRTWQIVPVGSARASHVDLTDRPVALRPDGSLLLDVGGRLVDEAERVPTDQSVDLLLDVSATGDVLLDRPVDDDGSIDRTLAIHPVDGTPVVLDRAPPGLRSAAFSPDGRYVLALGRTVDVADDVLVSTTWTGTLWDTMSGDVLSRFERQGALTAAWLDDAAFAVLEGADTVTTYEVIAADFGPPVTAAAATSGVVVTASVTATSFDQPGQVVIDVRMNAVDDAARMGEITTAPGSAPRPEQLVVSDDGRYAFFHGSLIDLATGGVTALVDPDSSDTTLAEAAFLPDGETIAVALGEGVTLHDTTDGAVIGQLPLVGRIASTIAAFPDGVRLAVGASPLTPDDDAALFVVDLTTGRWTLVADEHPTSSIAIVDDTRMVVGRLPDTVTVWDTSTPTPTVVHEFTPSVGLVGNLSVSDDGRRLLVSGTAGVRFQAQVWDLERAVLVERLDSLLLVSARTWSGVTFVGDGLLGLYGGDGLALLPDVAPDVVCAAISEEVLDEVEAFTGTEAACRRIAP
jgi:WD40 repeat protein